MSRVGLSSSGRINVVHHIRCSRLLDARHDSESGRCEPLLCRLGPASVVGHGAVVDARGTACPVYLSLSMYSHLILRLWAYFGQRWLSGAVTVCVGGGS